MKDILTDIYNVLITDDFIVQHVRKNNIRFNKYPEPNSINETHIILDEIDDPLPASYADNDNLALSYLVQVDVYTKVKNGINARKLRDELSYRISRLLKDKLGMTNTSNGKPEYDETYGLYRSARRYEGVFYRTDL